MYVTVELKLTHNLYSSVVHICVRSLVRAFLCYMHHIQVKSLKHVLSLLRRFSNLSKFWGKLTNDDSCIEYRCKKDICGVSGILDVLIMIAFIVAGEMRICCIDGMLRFSISAVLPPHKLVLPLEFSVFSFTSEDERSHITLARSTPYYFDAVICTFDWEIQFWPVVVYAIQLVVCVLLAVWFNCSINCLAAGF